MPGRDGEPGGLPPGKLPASIIAELTAKIRATVDPATRQGPGIGEDAGIISLPCCDLAIHSDPITEAGSRIGWLALHVAANDVATTGACPRWVSITILLPPGSSTELAFSIASEIASAARELGVDIVGGHTEISPGIEKPVVVATVVGLTCPGCALRTGDVRPGDRILLVGYAGLEGTSIIASDFPSLLQGCMSESEIRETSQLASSISVVKPACLLASNRLARAMHDATEGGVIGALVEMALASRLTIRVDVDSIPVHPLTRKLAECAGLDPLKLISSGALLVAVPEDLAGRAVELLEGEGYNVAIIGRAVDGPPLLVLSGSEGETQYLEPPPDEISRVWSSGEEKG